MTKLNLTPEERAERKREQAAQRQQKFRDKKRNPIPDAWDYQQPEAQSEQLGKYSNEIARQISLELYPVSPEKPWPLNLKDGDRFIVDGIATVTLAIENNWGQHVNNPCGILTGSFFPDALASEAIKHVLSDPLLLKSPTFVELYKRFIKTVAAFCDKEKWMTLEYVKEIKQELEARSVEEERARQEIVSREGTRIPTFVAASPCASGTNDPNATQDFSQQI
jgi:hypothetical protein